MYVAHGRRRNRNGRLAGTDGLPASLGDGFSWGGFFSNIGAQAGQAVAAAGIQRLTSSIATPGTSSGTAAQQYAAQQSVDPTWLYVGGGFMALLLLIVVVKR